MKEKFYLNGKSKFIVFADKVARQREEVKSDKELLKLKADEFNTFSIPMSVKVEVPASEILANTYMIKVDSNGEFIVNFDENVKKDVQLKPLQKM